LGVVTGPGHPKLKGTIGAEKFKAVYARSLPASGAATEDAPNRTAEETFGRLMLAIAAVILAARGVGVLVRSLGQPQVMGEVLAGILLGPTLLGAVAPEVKDYLFPADIVPLLAGAAQILPLVSLSWLENGGEFRRTGWTIAPDYQPMPIVARTDDQTQAGQLLREFSRVGAVPAGEERAPALSGVHPRSAEPS
jgi:hypothetical protein